MAVEARSDEGPQPGRAPRASAIRNAAIKRDLQGHDEGRDHVGRDHRGAGLGSVGDQRRGQQVIEAGPARDRRRARRKDDAQWQQAAFTRRSRNSMRWETNGAAPCLRVRRVRVLPCHCVSFPRAAGGSAPRGRRRTAPWPRTPLRCLYQLRHGALLQAPLLAGVACTAESGSAGGSAHRRAAVRLGECRKKTTRNWSSDQFDWLMLLGSLVHLAVHGLLDIARRQSRTATSSSAVLPARSLRLTSALTSEPHTAAPCPPNGPRCAPRAAVSRGR